MYSFYSKVRMLQLESQLDAEREAVQAGLQDGMPKLEEFETLSYWFMKCLVVNSMHNPFIVQVIPREEATSLEGTDLVGAQPQEGTPYVTLRAPLLSDWGMPCTPPPWGLITSIDLATGDVEWQRPLANPLHSVAKAVLC